MNSQRERKCGCVYLQDFLDRVIDDEENEEDLAAQDEIIERVDVANQFHRAEFRRGDQSTNGRKFKDQSDG